LVGGAATATILRVSRLALFCQIADPARMSAPQPPRAWASIENIAFFHLGSFWQIAVIFRVIG
jgi:hypothetical protein